MVMGLSRTLRRKTIGIFIRPAYIAKWHNFLLCVMMKIPKLTMPIHIWTKCSGWTNMSSRNYRS